MLSPPMHCVNIISAALPQQVAIYFGSGRSPAMPMMLMMTPLLRARHARQDVARQVDIAEDLEVPAMPPSLRRHLVERAARHRAGIVDEDIAVAGHIRQGLDVLVPGEIEGVGRDRDPVPLLDVVGQLLELCRCRWR